MLGDEGQTLTSADIKAIIENRYKKYTSNLTSGYLKKIIQRIRAKVYIESNNRTYERPVFKLDDDKVVGVNDNTAFFYTVPKYDSLEDTIRNIAKKSTQDYYYLLSDDDKANGLFNDNYVYVNDDPKERDTYTLVEDGIDETGKPKYKLPDPSKTPKGFYMTLGVNQDATSDQIRKAYYTLSRKHHPDKTRGDDTIQKKVIEAYETLSDSGKRARYDMLIGRSGGSTSKRLRKKTKRYMGGRRRSQRRYKKKKSHSMKRTSYKSR
jgi:hypothetical protein